MNPPRQERNFLSCFFLPEAAQRLTPRGPWGRAVIKNSAPRRCGERKALDLLALRVSHQLVPSLPVFFRGDGRSVGQQWIGCCLCFGCGSLGLSCKHIKIVARTFLVPINTISQKLLIRFASVLCGLIPPRLVICYFHRILTPRFRAEINCIRQDEIRLF